MFSIILVALFVFGAVIASFVGVISERLYTGQDFLAGRSRCDACNAPLSLYALVPVISYVVSSGRSLCCNARISWLSPITEMLLGGLFVLSYLNLGITFALSFFLMSLSILLALVLYDLSHQILPSSLLAVFVMTSVVARFSMSPSISEFSFSLIIAFSIAAFFALIHFASSGRAIGLADAPLSLGLALLVGPAALPGFIFSFWIGAVIGIALLYSRPRGSRIGVEVPFAPYLAAGFLLAYFTQWNPFIFAASLPLR